MRDGLVVVISGPSGVGKGTVCKEIMELTGARLAVSATTRKPRAGERDGKEYHFLLRDEFERMIADGELAEYVNLFGNYYGTPKAELSYATEGGGILLLDIDVKGVIRLRDAGVDALFILLLPPDMETLKQRLKKRGTETDSQLEARLELAKWELKQGEHYDFTIVNDDLDTAVREITAIIKEYGNKE